MLINCWEDLGQGDWQSVGVTAACCQLESLWPILGREPFLRPWVEASPHLRGLEVPD